VQNGEEKMPDNKKKPNPIDIHVGSRVRLRRNMLGMSQEKLGESLGITFQQIQKYEKGANRVAAGRLQRIAEVLHVPITFLYSGSERKPRAEEDSVEVGLSFLETAGAVRLVRAYSRIEDRRMRRALVELTERIAE
jgi:transcriptional regulator with XRE-family HTH domain